MTLCDIRNMPRSGNSILWGVGLVFCSLISAVHSDLNAQESDEYSDDIYELEAFEVTGGFSGSLAAAAEQKKIQPVIVEAIVAEDIGKLPDSSIAESLARLPGLTTQRINSRAQGIVIRGLTGDFSTALLNGRQQVSTGADRAVEFDQYPAELLNGVVVYKTTNPSLVGQGLAGTIDMRTIRPLSMDKEMFAANVFVEKSSLGKLNPDSEDTGIRYSLNYADQLAGGKLGIAFGYAYTDQPGQGEQYNAWGYATTAAGENVIGGIKPFARSSELIRSSYMGVIEYRPNRNFHTTVDLFYSDFAETQIMRGIEIPLGFSSAVLQPGYSAEDGLVTDGVFDNVYMVMRNDRLWRDAKVYNAGWNLRFGDGTGWVFELDLSSSKIERKDNVLETYSGYTSNQASDPDTVAFHMTSTGIQLTTALDYADGSRLHLGSPQGWGSGSVPGGQVGFFKGPEAQDDLRQFQSSAQLELNGNFWRKIELGAAYTWRNKWEVDAGPGGLEGWFLALPDGKVLDDMPPSIGVTSLSFIGIPGQYSYSPKSLWDSGYYDTITNTNVNLLANNFDVKEEVAVLYGQLDFESEFFQMPLSGSFGTQIVKSEQSSHGIAANGTGVVTVTGSHDYVDIVPSLNFILNISDLRKVRLSLARQLARQEMVDMRCDSVYSFNETLAASTDVQSSPWSGFGGNPELEPWRSNSIDLTYENYFEGGMGYWALNAFYKKLVSYTYNESVLADFTGYDTNSDVEPAIYQGYRTTPQNGDGGQLYGIEGTLSIPGEKISEGLSGFGLILSGSWTKSSIEPNPGSTQEIPGLSEYVINSTLYYERGGFAARISGRYRSDYRGDISTFGPRGEVFRNLQDETVMDAQISYSFAEGSPLAGMTITLQGYNLTDEPLFATQGAQDDRLVIDHQRYGSQYSMGISYKF